MAGDGRSVDPGGVICSDNVVKVRRLKDGSILGVAGTPFQIEPLVEWMDGRRTKFPELEDDWDALRLMPDGSVRSYGVGGQFTLELVPAAVGSGGDIALGAMLAGCDPASAVDWACERHSGCGGTIIEESLRG